MNKLSCFCSPNVRLEIPHNYVTHSLGTPCSASHTLRSKRKFSCRKGPFEKAKGSIPTGQHQLCWTRGDAKVNCMCVYNTADWCRQVASFCVHGFFLCTWFLRRGLPHKLTLTTSKNWRCRKCRSDILPSFIHTFFCSFIHSFIYSFICGS